MLTVFVCLYRHLSLLDSLVNLNGEQISDAAGSISVHVSETWYDGAINMNFIDKLYHLSTGNKLHTNSYLHWDLYGLEKIAFHSDWFVNSIPSWDTSAAIVYKDNAYEYIVEDYSTRLLTKGTIQYYFDSLNWYLVYLL